MWTGEGLRHGTPPQSGGEAVTAPFIVIKPFLPDPNFVQEIGAPGALARFWTRVEAGISRCCLTLPRAVADQAGLDPCAALADNLAICFISLISCLALDLVRGTRASLALWTWRGQRSLSPLIFLTFNINFCMRP